MQNFSQYGYLPMNSSVIYVFSFFSTREQDIVCHVTEELMKY